MLIGNISNIDELRKAFEHSNIVVLDVFASWCGPCKVISPYFQELATTYSSPNMRFYKYNCGDDNDLAHFLEVSSIPTFIVFENGELAERMSGANKTDLTNLVKRYATL